MVGAVPELRLPQQEDVPALGAPRPEWNPQFAPAIRFAPGVEVRISTLEGRPAELSRNQRGQYIQRKKCRLIARMMPVVSAAGMNGKSAFTDSIANPKN